jgi:hypothetical protein
MRIAALVLGSAIVGTVAGIALAYIEVNPGEVAPKAALAHENPPPPGAAEPRVTVDAVQYDFGTMQRGTKKSHDFLFRNVGNGPLTLRVGSTTCKCTLGSVPADPIPPGGQVNVTLEWTAKVGAGNFRQMATVITNDPIKERVELQVDGQVTEATGVYPQEFVFDKIVAGESKSADVYVMAMNQDHLEVTNPTLSDSETAKYFDVKIQPVDHSELPSHDAKQGVKITVTAKPGLPLGRFAQWLTVSTNIDDAKTMELLISGRVVGNINVHGHLWNEEQNVLRLGTVKSDEGTSTTLNIVIRGDDAASTKVAVESCDPPELIAKVGQAAVISPTLVHVPLEVSIPPGTPPMARMETQQSEAGKIVLATTGKDANKMVLHVRFAVEH